MGNPIPNAKVAAQLRRDFPTIRKVEKGEIEMSTRCLIGLETAKNGEVKYIYSHSDGYIKGGVGEILSVHYADAAKVGALIDGGSISALGAEIGLASGGERGTGDDLTFFYMRDGGESASHNLAKSYPNMTAFAQKQASEYQYLYCFSDGDWLVYNKRTAVWERVTERLK